MKSTFKYEFNSIFIAVMLLLLFFILIQLSSKYNVKLDLTSNRVNTLSPYTLDLLKKAKQPIKVTGFIIGGSDKTVSALLDLYSSASSKFTYAIYDPDLSPQKSAEYEVTYNMAFFVESGSKRERIKNLNEENLTNGILHVLNPKRKNVRFITGHGEVPFLEGANGVRSLSLFNAALSKEVYTTSIVNLNEQLPKDTDLLIEADPKTELSKPELESLENYLKAGGKMLWLVGPNFNSTCKKFLAKYGVSISDSFVEDEGVKFLGGTDIIALASVNPNSDITTNMQQTILLLPLARSIVIDQKSQNYTTPLMYTSAKSKLVSMKDGKVIDSKGSYIVALSLEKSVTENKNMKMVVVGSANFIFDKMLTESRNRDFIMNSVAWLTDEGNLISVRPKDTSFTRLNLSDSKLVPLFIQIVLLPAMFFPLFWLSLNLVVKFRKFREKRNEH